VSCSLESKTCVRSGYDECLAAEVCFGVGQGRELGDEERADEVLRTGRWSAAGIERSHCGLRSIERLRGAIRGAEMQLDSQIEIREWIPHS
jgi:hypothetical protein